MQPELFFVLLIPLLVWVLSVMFKTDEDKGKRPGQPGRPPMRRASSDLDRFLEEARRRRQVAERPPERPAPQPPREPQRASERRAPRREPGTRAKPSTQRRAPTQPVPMPVEVVPVRLQPEPEPIVLVPESVPVLLPESENQPPPLRTPPAVAGERAVQSPALTTVANLLKSPRTAGAVFLLREIFDPPLSRRRR